jgi:acetyl-CoA carboxylase biotin carboxyl carrier protein
MDLKQVEALIKLLGDYDVNEFQFKDKSTEMKLRFGTDATVMVAAPQPVQVAAAVAAPSASAPAAEPADASDGLVVIEAPMVGTFYSSPNPDSPPFVAAGQRVTKGTVLCIVEAMKLMNEIECEMNGEIVEVCIENAQSVQFGQALFKIRPA